MLHLALNRRLHVPEQYPYVPHPKDYVPAAAEIRGRGAVDELAGDPPALGLDELPE